MKYRFRILHGPLAAAACIYVCPDWYSTTRKTLITLIIKENLSGVTLHNFMFRWPCILVQSCEENQLDAQNFLMCLLLFSTCFGQLCAHHQEKITVPMRYLVFVTLYRWTVCGTAGPHTSHLYRVTNTNYRIGTVIFSWWWAHSYPKHVEKSNKHIKKFCAPSWFYSQE
jgi:hypothetical protein